MDYTSTYHKYKSLSLSLSLSLYIYIYIYVFSGSGQHGSLSFKAPDIFCLPRGSWEEVLKSLLVTALCSLEIILSACAHTQLFSPVWLLAALWTVALHASLSVEFSRQEYWSGVPFPSAGDLHDLGIEPTSPAAPALAGRFFTTEPYEKPLRLYWVCQKVHLRFLMKNPNELFGQLSRCYISPCHAPPNTL